MAGTVKQTECLENFTLPPLPATIHFVPLGAMCPLCGADREEMPVNVY